MLASLQVDERLKLRRADDCEKKENSAGNSQIESCEIGRYVGRREQRMEEIKQVANPINNAEKYEGRESSKNVRKPQPDGEILPKRDGFKFTENNPMNGP